jgi:methylenetetrahydrofolate--tRNA-(uracil-5-)-methyltransferase
VCAFLVHLSGERQFSRRSVSAYGRDLEDLTDFLDKYLVVESWQWTGVEGYTESTAVGIHAAVNLDRVVRSLEPVVPPPTTMRGGLLRYLAVTEPSRFQPMNSNFGLLDPLPEAPRDKQAKREVLSRRGQEDFASWMRATGVASANEGAIVSASA